MQDVIAIRDGEKVVAVGGVPPKEKDAATVAFEEALAAKLKGILAKPLGSQVLLELEMSARLGRQFLMLNEGPAAMPRSGFGMGGYGGYGGGLGMDYGDPLAGALVPTIGGPQNAETFGANIIREGIAAISNMNKRPPSLKDILESIKIAKAEGMTEIVAKLQKELDLALSPEGVVDEDLERILADGAAFENGGEKSRDGAFTVQGDPA